MSRPRLKNDGLPTRMYLHGRAYRIHLIDGSKVPLGRDLTEALTRYHVVMHTPVPAAPEKPEDVALTMWRRHKKGARQRKLPFFITVDEIRAILIAQGGRCAVTALAFRNDKPAGVRIRPWLASLDRLDGARGYEAGNCRVVCAFVNVAMNGFGESLFRSVLAPLIDAAVWADRRTECRLDSTFGKENGNRSFPIPESQQALTVQGASSLGG